MNDCGQRRDGTWLRCSQCIFATAGRTNHGGKGRIWETRVGVTALVQVEDDRAEPDGAEERE